MCYSVNFWGSYPGANDDCWMGEDYDSLEKALEVFDAPVNEFAPHMSTDDVHFVELDGPETYKVRVNPDWNEANDWRVKEPHPDTEWHDEIRREEAMLQGIGGWNDYG